MRSGTLFLTLACQRVSPLKAYGALTAAYGALILVRPQAMLDPMVAPGAAYYALTSAGIVAALAVIVGTFPLLARVTGPEVARNE